MSDTPLAPRPTRSTVIKNLTPRLPEKGHIKIGEKGKEITSRGGNKFQPPKKLDHFKITTMTRDATGNFCLDEAIHAKLGATPTDIPVRLIYDSPELSFPTRYAAYKGKNLWCSGDGETAQRMDDDQKVYKPVQCPCFRQEQGYKGPDKCKINGSLSVMIDGAGGVGGVWKFRTTSYNSVVGILSSLGFLRQITGGPLANIPLTLMVRPKQATDPDGNAQTIYVVSLEYPGDISELQRVGYDIALERAKTHIGIAQIEDEARQALLAAPMSVPLPGDDTDDIVEEFYPEQVDGSIAPPARPQRGDFTKTAMASDAGETTKGSHHQVLDAEGHEVGWFNAARAVSMIAGMIVKADSVTVIAVVENNDETLSEINAAGQVMTADIDAMYQAALKEYQAVNIEGGAEPSAPFPGDIPSDAVTDLAESLKRAYLAAQTADDFNKVSIDPDMDLLEKESPTLYAEVQAVAHRELARIEGGPNRLIGG